ncbi:hypothetical protein UFOVP115_91 [uncultured Caudovirales phage]|uniref:Uncharacterized protein n=1 Tax=uncultured Caudovirales phage TaxID=2100421 RepID=A0A6J5LDB5_9CAUD|nr:hypothetical protein UFOVP115_91 [uncultured Caudovirales phage]
MPKYTVFITYGVTVETDEKLAEENFEEVSLSVSNKAVTKMFLHGENEVALSADFEIEEWDESE